MASIKVFSLLIKTLSKPIASRIKTSAQEHPKFRKVCVGIAQSLHRYETHLASGIFANVQPTIRPLSDTKAIQNGANFLSEAFLFSVAVALIVGENLRGRIQTAHRRDLVNDRLTELEDSFQKLRAEQERLVGKLEPLVIEYEHRALLDSERSESPEPLVCVSQSANDLQRIDTPPSLAGDELVRCAEVALGWRKS